MLKLTGIHKTFFAGTVNERRALVDINLSLEPGDFLTIIGSNGAGKSTLLNTLAGRYSPDRGSVTIAGRDVTKLDEPSRAKFVGRVFQDPMAGTAPNLTIEQNMALALSRGKGRGLRLGLNAAKRDLFRQELKSLDLGLEDRLTAKVGVLSGGQRQALSLLMAGFTHPDILLLDEHTAALDPQRAELVTNLTDQIVKRGKLTTVMVTHNMQQALSLGNKLLMMHEGQIVFTADAAAKAQLTVADLLGEFAKIKGASLDDRAMLS
ncbi:ABC transporter ATP-binding protein [Canibacter zhoujuaniae]|uniref:ABC transporter ATP-binding protein n=1 Tax=Canibacter zhoujuaniae TaxID=2708343 RepID=UPI00141F4C13|nr:ABC transporter ATP-binding protein [Canibacter zhoujuaniae]